MITFKIKHQTVVTLLVAITGIVIIIGLIVRACLTPIRVNEGDGVEEVSK